MRPNEAGHERPSSIVMRVPTGGRAIIVADLHLGPVADRTTEATTAELSRLLDTVEGAALLVFAGDTFELAASRNNRPSKALAAHPRFASAAARFASGHNHAVVVLAGDRDQSIVEDVEFRREVEHLLSASVGSVLDLEIETGRRLEHVRVEHGGRFDDGAGPAGANGRARHHALCLAAEGFDGLVTGHTLAAELGDLGTCWYANCGGTSEVFQPRAQLSGRDPGSERLPRISWLELEAGAMLHVRLVASRSPPAGTHLLDRFWSRHSEVAVGARPAVVATLASGQTWPPEHLSDPTRRPQRIGSAGLALVGAINVLSALTPPFRERLEILHRVFPLAVPEVAAAAVAGLGVGLCVLAAAVRRGQRRAWAVSLLLLAASVVGHITKGLDIEEALVATGLFGYLASNQAAFAGRSSKREGLGRLALLAGVVVGSGLVGLVTIVNAADVPFRIALPAVGVRLIGLSAAPLPTRANLFNPVLAVVGLGSIALAIWTLLRPARSQPGDDDRIAWELVQRHASDTLDYFALRDDKQRFVWGSTVVAYAVRNGTAVVSPDPVGPADQRVAAWCAFRQHAAGHSWNIAVLGAGAGWLPTYRAAGMTPIYVGDEGLVDVQRFSLEGGRQKSLRQAVNRVARSGYTVSFHDPAVLPRAFADQLRSVMAQSRRGDMERGFSMTLSRMFDTRDTGLLLAVASTPEGSPAAFCQFVPAPGIGGYSLDLMRRADGDHPNGLTDFVVVRTIEHFRALGMRGLGLNFATMRAVVAGETPDCVTTRMERRLLHRLSDDMQIESLWRFSAKFDPTWRPRFLVLEAPELAFGTSLAIARAESFCELPIIGRFLRSSPKVAAEASSERLPPRPSRRVDRDRGRDRPLVHQRGR